MEPKVERLSEMIAYQTGSVVSRKIMGGKKGNVTLFAFDSGEGLTEHTSPYAARVVVLDGVAEIRIGGDPVRVTAGETVLLPPSIPHALDAPEPFKMLLIMLKEEPAESSS